MLKNLNWYLVCWAITRISPDVIPLSDPTKLKKRNYYTVRFHFDDSGETFVLREKTNLGATGYLFKPAQSSGVHASLPKDSLGTATVEITHYFRGYEVKYESALAFLFGKMTFKPVRVWFSDCLGQSFFNQKTIRNSERLAVLSDITERAILEGEHCVDAFEYLSRKYGPRWFGHPDNKQASRHLILLLESLENSGELTREGKKLRVNGSAIFTLAQAELENRRHLDNVRQQRLLAILTACLVVVGAIQIYLGWQAA